MRITPIIRDYITEEVGKAFPKTEVELDYEYLVKQCGQVIEEATSRGKETALEFINNQLEYLGLDNLDLTITPSYLYRNTHSLITTETKLYHLAKDAAKARKAKIKEVINTVFVQCELGAKIEHLAAIVSEAIKEGRNEG